MRCAVVALMVASGIVVVDGCFFAPNIAADGYASCKTDDDCAPGRLCSGDEGGLSVCAPPPWHDQKFENRRLLTVKNAASALMPKGTAVPVVVGGAHGNLKLDDVAADFRIADFDTVLHKWSVLSVFVDRESDRFTIWIPTSRDIKQGRSDALAWIESGTPDTLSEVAEDPRTAFAFYDDFDEAALDDVTWRIQGTPTIANGIVNIAQDQGIVMKKPVTGPVTMTAIVRVNGQTCSQVFVGLIGDDRSLFPVGPAAGLFIDANLAARAEIAPTATSVPTPVGDGTVAKTSFQRISVAVDGKGVHINDDDTVAYAEADLRPPFSTDPMYPAVQVGGACSVDVDALWLTPLPQPAPVITAGALIQFQLFQ